MIDAILTASAPAPTRHATRRRHQRVLDAATALVGLGMGAVIAMPIDFESAGAWRAPGGVATFFGELFGLTGAYLMLLMLLLVARIPWVERAAGQDRLVRWHRNLGQWPVYLLCLHAVLVTVGYAEADHLGVWHQFTLFIQAYPDVLASTVALALIIIASVLSIRAARRRMRYETWWSVHLYLYLALALAFAHQIANGQSFLGHPLPRVLWAVLWGTTAGVVLLYRFVMPLARSLYHQLRVVSVQQEGPDVVSVVCSGRHLRRLRIEGGQFFLWRFLAPGMWWAAHPYTLSALPRSNYVRVTIKGIGDHSAAARRLAPGTRVLVEGPYGAFTRHARHGEKVLLIGAGVGVTPIRALLEHLERDVDVAVILRSPTAEEHLFREEFFSLVDQRGGRLHLLTGNRRKHSLDGRHLLKLVPDIAERDVYVCGPGTLNDRLLATARTLGVDEKRIHCEQFSF